MSRPPDLPAPLALPDDLADAVARAGSRPGSFGADLLYFGTVGSTNDIAARFALAGARDGTTVLAEAQSAGRGRMGRAWFSPPGAGLYASVIIRPETAQPVSLFTLVAGVALAEALRATTALPVDIKWPNDLVVGRRKLCGILAEGHASHGRLQHVVVGFGINLRSAAYPAQIADRATSVEAELGRPVERGTVLAASLAALAARYEDLRASRFGAILSRWRALSPCSSGAAIEWTTAGGAHRGVTAGIDDDGALLVRADDRVERIIAGEVRWL
ncbi:MAG: biotin--[acetyl-CoA-carboxylase] ligase [Acidobacteria bacterium]|nr:biotin--[acetyl-CoA-carboxylase] ligase [Acidobacteriota bacterium]